MPEPTVPTDPCEVWKPIPEYSQYEASTLGNVRSVDRMIPAGTGTRFMPGRTLRQNPNTRGYLQVRLHKGSEAKSFAVHRIILTTFVGPRPDGMETRHLNGDRRDNRLTNLAYGTPKENAADRVAHGTSVRSDDGTCPQGHPYTEDNLLPFKAYRECRACDRERRKTPRYRELRRRRDAEYRKRRRAAVSA